MDLKLYCIVVMASMSVGCASTIESTAARSSEAAVEEGLEELTTAQTDQERGDDERPEAGEEAQARPAATRGAAAPQGRLQTGAADLGAQISRSVLATLESERAQRRIASITGAATHAALTQSLQTLDQPPAQEQVAELSRQVASATVEEMTEKLTEDEVQGALASATRNASHQAVMGTAAGLDDVWRSDATSLWSWLWLPVVLLALVCLALVAGAVIAVARARRARAELARLERAALLLATAVRQGHRGDGDPERAKDSEELATMIQHSLGVRPRTDGSLRDFENAR